MKGIYLICIVIAIYSLEADALPRDSSVLKEDALSDISSSTVKVPPPQVISESEYQIPGRVNCPYEEATEDVKCQEHCLPKGYSYGICVSRTCSCI